MILEAGFKTASSRCLQSTESHEVGDGLGWVLASKNLRVFQNETKNLFSRDVLGAPLEFTSIRNAVLVAPLLPDKNGVVLLSKLEPAQQALDAILDPPPRAFPSMTFGDRSEEGVLRDWSINPLSPPCIRPYSFFTDFPLKANS